MVIPVELSTDSGKNSRTAILSDENENVVQQKTKNRILLRVFIERLLKWVDIPAIYVLIYSVFQVSYTTKDTFKPLYRSIIFNITRVGKDFDVLFHKQGLFWHHSISWDNNLLSKYTRCLPCNHGQDICNS